MNSSYKPDYDTYHWDGYPQQPNIFISIVGIPFAIIILSIALPIAIIKDKIELYFGIE